MVYRHKKVVRPQQNMLVITEDEVGEGDVDDDAETVVPDWMRPGTQLVRC